VVSGTHLLPNVNEENTKEKDFYVLKVIEQIELNKINRERNIRLFPEKMMDIPFSYILD
jgi:hypothetical protein